MADPTGESKGEALRLDFDRRLMLWFRGSVITSNGGLLAYREMPRRARSDHKLRWEIGEPHTGQNRRHLLVGLLQLWPGMPGHPGNAGFKEICRTEDRKTRIRVPPELRPRPVPWREVVSQFESN